MVDISNINTIAVIGAGLMGYGIAQVSLMAGFEKVILNDISIEKIEEGAKNIENSLKKVEAEGKLEPGITPDILMSRLVKEVDLETAVKEADFVIEAIPEEIHLKQELFEKLGRFAPEHAILASNTSTMSITDIAKLSERVDKIVGMHFFIPLRMRLIEVIKGEETTDDTANICVEVGKRLPCIRGPRLVMLIDKESPGFIVNRLSIAGNMYLLWLVDQAYEKGITAEQLDADVGSFVSMGIYEIFDQLGLDVIYHTSKYFEEVLSPDFKPGKVLTQLVKEGNLGRKTGKGFYNYKDGRIVKNPDVEKTGMLDLNTLLAIQTNEGCRLLTEGIVSGYKQIDEAMLTGLGTPGPFSPARRNYKEWCKLLEDLAETTGKSYFKPCELMQSGGFLKMRK